MNHDKNLNDTAPSVSWYLEPELVLAIKKYDKSVIATRLGMQSLNFVTERINSHLIARNFLRQQMMELIILRDELIPGLDPDDIAFAINEFLVDLENAYSETFVSDVDGDKYDKLTGDSLFREAVASSKLTARYVVSLDTSNFSTHGELFASMQDIKEEVHTAIKSASYGATGMTRMCTISIPQLKDVIESQIEVIEQALERNFTGN